MYLIVSSSIYRIFVCRCRSFDKVIRNSVLNIMISSLFMSLMNSCKF